MECFIHLLFFSGVKFILRCSCIHLVLCYSVSAASKNMCFRAVVFYYIGTHLERLSIKLAARFMDIGCSDGKILTPCSLKAMYTIPVLIFCATNEAAYVFTTFHILLSLHCYTTGF